MRLPSEGHGPPGGGPGGIPARRPATPLQPAAIDAPPIVLGLILGLLFCDHIEAVHQFLRMITGTDVFSPEVYYLSTIPARIDWSETSAIVVMALVLSLIATLYPSWRAARTDPVEALRSE